MQGSLRICQLKNLLTYIQCTCIYFIKSNTVRLHNNLYSFYIIQQINSSILIFNAKFFNVQTVHSSHPFPDFLVFVINGIIWPTLCKHFDVYYFPFQSIRKNTCWYTCTDHLKMVLMSRPS